MDPRPIFDYDALVEQALRGVVREALCRAAQHGLPGDHHFYITFRTDAEGVAIPEHLAATHPEDITIVLQHEFWDLAVDDEEPDSFSVTLSFNDRRERLVVPFAAVTGFADPSAKFGLQFQYEDDFEDSLDDDPLLDAPPPPPTAENAAAPRPGKAAAPAADQKVVVLDAFRKK
ncbi:SspB family protein [Oleispirillum naphthae]|uniref:SspB family protein n=1 Tax=Oleispirillum naphthae TaxID=2838853 RepID=UPI003082363F